MPPTTEFRKLAFASADEMTDFIGSMLDAAHSSTFESLIAGGQRPVLFASLLPMRGDARIYVSEGLLELAATSGRDHWVAEILPMEQLPFGLSMILGSREDVGEYARTHT